MTDSNLQPVLAKAIAMVVRPLIKFWLKKGFSYQAFDEIMRWLFVDVTEENFKLKEKKLTDSRISVITGLTRHQVKHYRSIALEESPEKAKSNRSTRVITGWMVDKEFQSNGEPKELDINGGQPSFADLVKKYGGDISPKAVLDELAHSGQVEYSGKTTIRLLTKGYIPNDDEAALFEIMGYDTSVLLNTLEYNLLGEQDDKYFQKKVCYDNIKKENIEGFKQLSGKRAQVLLEELNENLSELSDDERDKDEDYHQVGLGIYYFQKRST